MKKDRPFCATAINMRYYWNMPNAASPQEIRLALTVVAQLADDDAKYGGLFDRLAGDLEEAEAREKGGTNAQNRARAFLAQAA